MRKSPALAFLVLVLAQKAAAQEPKEEFRLPPDQGGKLVEAILAPGLKQGGLSMRSSPLPRSTPRHLDEPDVPLPPVPAAPPRLELPLLKTTTPSHPSEPLPPARSFPDPAPPVAIVLPAGNSYRWPSADVHKPIALPILAGPSRDRASLADPTFDISLADAMRGVQVDRSSPVAFAPTNLPDPFELRRTVELQQPPSEHAQPPLATFPRLPGR